MYNCLTGEYPFPGTERQEVFDLIQSGLFDTSPKKMKHISEECIDLMKKMITVDPKKRITAAEILKH